MEHWKRSAAAMAREVLGRWRLLMVKVRRIHRRAIRQAPMARLRAGRLLALALEGSGHGKSPLVPRINRTRQRLAAAFQRIAMGLETVRTGSRGPDAWELEARDVPPAPPVGRWIGIGVIVFAVTFGGFGSWAALAPLSSASMTSGIIKFDSNRKTIQHYEGGIIREILVRDGDRVREGQVLVRLDDVEARADHESLRGQLDALVAREARLIAQRDGLEEIAFPESLTERKDSLQVAMILEGQRRIFSDQARSVVAETAVWRQRAEQYRAQIGSHQAHFDALEQQLATLQEEHAAASQLLERGFERRPRVLELERQISGARGEMAAIEGRISALREQIVEADLQVTALREARAKAVSEELREAQTQLAELTQRIEKSDAQVGRKNIVAPQDGVIVDLRYVTPGGVITPGAEVMDIVPIEDKLIVEARLQPLDIDTVHPGLRANVRLVAFKQRITPTLEGIVSRISADALTDQRTGELYFLVSIEVPPDELAGVPQAVLHPGMPVEVAIVTGERTLLAYLVQPFTDSLAHAFREE